MKLALLSRPHAGESQNGDAYLVGLFDQNGALRRSVASTPQTAVTEHQTEVVELNKGEQALVAVIDAVGHGPAAAVVASAVLQCLTRTCDRPLEQMIRYCHDNANAARGAAVGLLRLAPSVGDLSFCGVGDVCLHLFKRGGVLGRDGRPELSVDVSANGSGLGFRRQSLVGNSGLVGYRLPPALLVDSARLADGDVVVMHSDGLDKRRLLVPISPQRAYDAASFVELFVADAGKAQDDVTIAVAC